MAEEIGNGGYHEAFQQPIIGSREIDLKGRKIQEATQLLFVSTVVCISLGIYPFLVLNSPNTQCCFTT